MPSATRVEAESDLAARAAGLIRDAVVWDNHGCLPLTPGDAALLPELERYARAGWTTVSINVGYGTDSLEHHLRTLAFFRRWLRERSGRYLLVERPEDVEEARRSGRLGICFDVEGMAPLNGGRLELVELFHDLGVRWMLIAYNKATDAGAGCFDEADGGLTAFGREVIAEMARVGMVPCVSHTGARTALEVCDAGPGPVILSHSNPRALWEHRRNVSDELIRAVAASGGVIGLNGIGPFLGANDASTDTFVRHLDHVVQLVGPEHVGLGLDFMFDDSEMESFAEAHPYVFPGHDPARPVEMIEPERLSGIVQALLARGYGEPAVRAILGGNWLRIAHAVWPGRDRSVG